MTGLVVKGIAGFYYVKAEGRVFQCKARGVFKKDGVSPMVGDTVSIEALDDGSAVINSISQRKNEFARPPVSNVDCFVVVVAASKPEPNFLTIDRFLAMAEKNGAAAVICVNKADLANDAKVRAIKEAYEGVYPVICASALTGSGIEGLKPFLENKKCAFAGPSGVGKSTLLNALQPGANAETGELSRKTLRGRHTTRHVEIFEAGNGALVFDTPGFTSFDIDGVPAGELMHLFPEIAELYGQCRYKNCTHVKESGCAVADAVTAGGVRESRYRSYSDIYREIAENRR
ncbi:MAG: ribosome small subunit-dependent GTPase A [Clostridiales bacterium]|nr:ribosome small subunit-dependent GTPase A [Clostridiales bacterium]